MALTTNVPSDRFEDLQRDVQDATRFTNAVANYQNRVGATITPLPLLQEQINASIQSTGWFAAAGSFEAGGTITARNQYLQLVTTAGSDIAGGYTWGGTLPKVVPPGSTPATTGGTPEDGTGWVYRGETTVRAALEDGSADIGGVQASTIAGQSHILAVDYLPPGYVTDGSVDYLTEIQQAIDDGATQKRAVELPDFPVGIVVQVAFPGIGLTIPNNSVVFHRRNGQGELKVLPNANGNYRAVLLNDKDNIYIPFLRLRGDKFTHLGTGGEWGHGLVIDGSTTRVVIDEAEIYDCWGDCLYIGQYDLGEAAQPDNIRIGTVLLDNARRNGFSFTGGTNVYIDHVIANNTRSDNSSTPLPAGPHAGIDIEPDNGIGKVTNIQINKVSGKNNEDALFYVYLLAFANDFTGGAIGHVSLNVGSVHDEGSLFAVRMAGLGNTGKVQGAINIGEVYAKDTLSNAFVCTYWGFNVGLPVTIDHLSCANTGKGFGGNKFAAPVAIFSDSLSLGDIGNVTVNNLYIQRDDIGVGALAYVDNEGGLVKNVNINLRAADFGVTGNRYFGNGVKGVVNWTLPKHAALYVSTVTASGTISTILNQGVININSAASPTITLPTITAGMENAELEFYITAVLAHCDIQVSGGAIRSRDDSGTRYRTFAGDRIRLRARSGGIWNVVHVDGLFVKQA